MNYSKEIIVRSIKIIDIGYITSLYLILGIITAYLFDKYFGVFDKKKEEEKPLFQSIIELIFQLWLIGVVIYIARNIVPLIPFPLNGIYGFDHSKVKELTSAVAFSISFMYFFRYYEYKSIYVISKLTNSE